MFNLVIFGGPGSGKGTQSDLLIAEYGLFHISTGEVLRDQISRGTELGKIADSFISGGNLIPDELMISILASVYDAMQPCDGVIFDGFPRTIPQAEALNVMLQERNSEIAAMLELDVPQDMLVERLVNRGLTSGRADDNEETIRKRLDVYNNQTQPLIAFYEAEGKRNPVKGYGDIQEIHSALCAVIDKL